MFTTRKMNLLVVDDDRQILRLISRAIEKQMSDKITLTAVTEPTEAREWLERNCCDVLLSDVEMPDMTGLDLLRISKRRNAWTQVIFMTAHSTWERIIEAIEQGATDYVVKPIQIEDLLTVLNQQYQRYVRWQVAAQKTFANQGRTVVAQA